MAAERQGLGLLRRASVSACPVQQIGSSDVLCKSSSHKFETLTGLNTHQLLTRSTESTPVQGVHPLLEKVWRHCHQASLMEAFHEKAMLLAVPPWLPRGLQVLAPQPLHQRLRPCYDAVQMNQSSCYISKHFPQLTAAVCSGKVSPCKQTDKAFLCHRKKFGMYQSSVLQRTRVCTSAKCFDMSIFAAYAYPFTVKAADRILKCCEESKSLRSRKMHNDKDPHCPLGSPLCRSGSHL